ncbi:MAG: hypothetical protein KKA19_04305 [Candidatus Margulisbacteria bacterium]|nr:hypothetical protein [Candidatus Margulisiibacteriota bacterium]
MKKLILIGFCLLLATAALAHPPKDIKLKVDGTKLEVVVIHPVGENKLHFIDKIEVSVNGKKLIKQTFLVQGNENEQKAIYLIPSLKKEDIVKVSANCNKYGDKSMIITIE